MSGNLDLTKIREYVKSHITSNGMEGTEDFLVQLFAKNPANPYDFAKAYFKDPTEKNKAQLVSGILTNYIKEYGNIPEDDLKNLRQTTNDSYQKWNPTYWDAVGLCIKIIITDGTQYTDPKIKKMIILDRDLKQSYGEFTPEFWTRNTKPHVHTFRTLILRSDHFLRTPKTDMKWSDLITPIIPHITQLHFPYRWRHTLTTEKTVEFIQLFTNLKKFKIDGTCLYNGDPGQLEIVLRSLNPNIQVVVKVYSYDEAVFNRCENIPNITWIVSISGQLEDLTFFRQHPNLNVTFELVQMQYLVTGLQCLDKLQRTTDLCLEFQDKISKLKLWLGDDVFEDQDEAAVKNCLGLLRSVTTDLYLNFGLKNWNVTDDAWSWPKLSTLHSCFGIEHTKGNIPLAIKNNSPNLKRLGVYGSQSLIFNEPEKSDEDSIRDFFGPITLLEHLHLSQARIGKGNQLEDIVKSMLPKLNTIEYM